MDATTENSAQNVHIHNYSMFAIQSFILEVKKYPIIYNGNTRIPFSKGLIDFAWARIVTSLLDNSPSFDLAQKDYWERSFRELWKWMRLTLVSYMVQRRDNPVHVRGTDYDWLNYLKFLEPYINLDETQTLDPDILIRIIMPEEGNSNEHTIIWLRDSSEPVDAESKHISIRLRASATASIDFNRKPSSQMSGGNIVPLGRSGIPPFIETFKTDRVSVPDTVLPHQGPTTCTVLDEDFSFIMSLLPKLRQMEPRRNTEVKLQMIKALYESL